MGQGCFGSQESLNNEKLPLFFVANLVEERRVKLGIVSPRYTPSFGGIETHVQELASSLVRAGHDVDVITPDHVGNLPSIEMIDGVRVVRCPQLFPTEHFAFAPSITSHVKGSRSTYDLLHVHGYHATAALFAAAGWKGPMVFSTHYHGTGHSLVRSALHLPYKPFGKFILNRANAVIAVSPPEGALLADHFPKIADRIHVISNGVRVSEIRSSVAFERNEVGLAPETRVVLVSGRQETYKRVDRAISAMRHLDSRYRLIVTGDGPARGFAEDHARKEGLTDRVEFLGRVSSEDLGRWRRTASVFVTLSEQEAQSVVLLEAIAAQTPAVASDIPAHRSVADLAPKAVQLLPLTGSTADIARAIERAVDITVEPSAVLDWEDVRRMTMAVYRSVLGLRPEAEEANPLMAELLQKQTTNPELSSLR